MNSSSNFQSGSICLAIFFVSSFCAAADSESELESELGFVSMFDGESLKGWTDKGMIQLQLHDPGMVVHFKDLRIKVLD